MAVSRVREPNIHKALKVCRIKESEGFECIRKIQKVYAYRKTFKQDGSFYEYKDTEQEFYYEAIYRKG